ncbi:MAG: hypothetical protein U0805_18360 [Pirellulales bacterium]
MPDFSIKELLLGMALVALGLSLEILYFRHATDLDMPVIASFYCVFGGAAAIGAGLLAPFQQKAFGLVIGVGAVVCFFFIVLLL